MEDLYRYIDENRERFVEELLRLVEQPSVSTSGEGIEDFGRLLAGFMKDAGVQAEILPTDYQPLICGKVSGADSGRNLLFLDHYDVVPAGPLENWANPPFQPVIKDNRIWARGVGDPKGQLYAYIKAVEAFRKVRGILPVNINMAFFGDDEIGIPSLKYVLSNYRDRFNGEAAIWADASTLDYWGPAVILGSRGVLAFELKASGAKFEAHSGSYGGLLRNPAIRLAHAIAALRDPDGRILVPGFYEHLRPLGKDEKVLLANLKVDKESKLRSLGTTEFWGDPDHDYFEIQQYRPTLNVHGLTSGYQGENWTMMVPSSATAKIDVNIVAHLDPVDLLAKIRKHLDANDFRDIEIKELAHSIAFEWSKPGDPFLDLVARAMKRVWNKETVMYPSIGGGGSIGPGVKDELGIPYFLVVPLGQPDMNEHSSRESLDIDWYINGIKSVATIIDEFAVSDIGKRTTER